MKTLIEKRKELMKAMNDARAGRNISEIPLDDVYWEAKKALQKLEDSEEK